MPIELNKMENLFPKRKSITIKLKIAIPDLTVEVESSCRSGYLVVINHNELGLGPREDNEVPMAKVSQT